MAKEIEAVDDGGEIKRLGDDSFGQRSLHNLIRQRVSSLCLFGVIKGRRCFLQIYKVDCVQRLYTCPTCTGDCCSVVVAATRPLLIRVEIMERPIETRNRLGRQPSTRIYAGCYCSSKIVSFLFSFFFSITLLFFHLLSFLFIYTCRL